MKRESERREPERESERGERGEREGERVERGRERVREFIFGKLHKSTVLQNVGSRFARN